MSRIVRASLALLIVVGAALWGAGLHQPDGVEASGHSASRTFASPWVAPGGQLQVTITAMDYGAFGQVVETLPAGFRFVRSSLPAAAVNAGTDTVKFTLLGDERFTYTVEAPAAEGTYDFSGLLLDRGKEEQQVGGDTSLRVGPAPTPASTPAPTPESTATATATATAVPTAAPTVAPTRTPPPTSTATPRPMATPTPRPAATPTLEPTATPVLQPTATPAPQPTATPTRVPLASPPRTDESGGVPGWVILLGAVIIAAGAIAWIAWWRSGRPRQ